MTSSLRARRQGPQRARSRWGLWVFGMLLVAGCAKAEEAAVVRVAMSLAETEWQVMRQEVFPRFERTTGIRVEAAQLEAGDLAHVLEAMVSAGRVRLDLVAQDNMQLASLVTRELVEDLSDLESGLPGAIPARFVEAGRFGTQLYFLPYRVNVQITYYHEGHFAAAGLTPPSNWDELLDVARTFYERDGIGRVLLKAWGDGPTTAQVYEFIVAAGGDPLTLNDAGCVRAFTFLQELWPYVSAESRKAKWDTTNDYLAREAVYLAQNWPFGVRLLVQEYGKFAIRTYHGFAGPVREAHVVGGEMLAIPRGAPHREEALAFVEFLQSRPIQELFVQKLGWPPIRQDAYVAVEPWMAPHFAAIREALEHGVFRKNVEYWNTFDQLLNEAFVEIVIEGGPVKATLDRYHERLQPSRQAARRGLP